MTLLLQNAADTLIVRQVTPDRAGFDQVVFIAAGLAQIVTLVVVVLLAIIFFRMWKAQQAMQEQLSRLTSKIDPMIASATAAAENVRELTDAVKQDAMAAAEAVSNATERVRSSVSGIADRIDEFGDLLGRVTSKAEAVADVAGAAVSTFKAGSRLFKRDEPPRGHGEQRHTASRHAERRHAEARHREPRHLQETPERDEPDEPIRLTEEEDGHESPYAEEAGGAGAVGDGARTARPKRRRNRRRRGGGGGGGAGGASDGGALPSP